MKESEKQLTILVPLDGSPLSERALPYAEHLAEATSARLVLTRVVPVYLIQPAEDDLDLADDARGYLQALADRLTAQGLHVETAMLWGDAASLIIEHARATQADMIVMGTHGRSAPGRWVYGSVADEVLRRASVPVVLVPPAAARGWATARGLRILVPLDGSPLGEAGLAAAEELAVRLGAELVLLQLVPWPPYALYGDGSTYLAAFDPDSALDDAQRYLESLAKQLTVSRVRIVSKLGEPSVTVSDVARHEEADLIAMATHGRSGVARVVLGSVATGTLQRATVPVMLVRPAALEAQTPETQPEAAAATLAR